MKIDVFPHILPRPYFDRMLRMAPSQLHMQKRMRGIPVLVDLDLRLQIMDRYEGYVQVLTIANPPIEIIGGPQVTPDLARLANDSLDEIDRAIGQLGATGVQMYTNVNGRALDGPEFQPLFARMAGLDLPIWLHP